MQKLKTFCIAVAVCSFLFSVIPTYGQRYYLDAGAGYGFNLASQPIDENYNNTTRYTSSTNSSVNNGTQESVAGSFGKGLMYGLTLGYMFSEHFGAEIGVSYLSGVSIKSTYTDAEYDDYGSGTTSFFTDNRTNTFTGTMLRIIPALRMQMGSGKISTYMKAGLVIGLNPSVKETENETSSFIFTGFSNTYTVDSTAVTTGKYLNGTSIGFMAAFGADIKLGNAFTIYCEIGMTRMTWVPMNSEITGYTKNGTDYLATLTTLQKETNYVDSYSYSTSTSSSPDSGVPYQQLKKYLPFSSWGFNVGVHLAFGSPLMQKK